MDNKKTYQDTLRGIKASVLIQKGKFPLNYLLLSAFKFLLPVGERKFSLSRL